MDDLISVIVPVYNAEKYLPKCIESILNQTYKNIELILVNDGSTDGSLTVCRAYEQKDSRVKVINKENGGAASARNVGLDFAAGRYIGFCDADDYIELNMYNDMIHVLIENDLDTLECTSSVYDLDGNLIWRDRDDNYLELQSSEDSIRRIFLRTGNVSLAVRLTKADIIKDIRIPEGRRVEDFYFTILLLMRVKTNGIYFAPYYNCVTTKKSVTRSATGSIYMDALYYYQEACKILPKDDMRLKDAQNYYRFKMYYLFAISATKDETKKYRKEIRVLRHDIRTNVRTILSIKELKKKEMIVLFLSILSISACRMLYHLKNGEKND